MKVDRTTDEYRLYVIRDDIRYAQERLARLKRDEAQLLSKIASDRERRERADSQRSQVAESSGI